MTAVRKGDWHCFGRNETGLEPRGIAVWSGAADTRQPADMVAQGIAHVVEAQGMRQLH